MAQQRYIKCRFCDWRIPRFRTRKDRSISGPEQSYGHLLDHIERDHRSEWPEIARQLEEIFAESESRETAKTFS